MSSNALRLRHRSSRIRHWIRQGQRRQTQATAMKEHCVGRAPDAPSPFFQSVPFLRRTNSQPKNPLASSRPTLCRPPHYPRPSAPSAVKNPTSQTTTFGLIHQDPPGFSRNHPWRRKVFHPLTPSSSALSAPICRFDRPFRQAQGPEPAEGLKALRHSKGAPCDQKTVTPIHHVWFDLLRFTRIQPEPPLAPHGFSPTLVTHSRHRPPPHPRPSAPSAVKNPSPKPPCLV